MKSWKKPVYSIIAAKELAITIRAAARSNMCLSINSR